MVGLINCQVFFLKVPSFLQTVCKVDFPDGSVLETIWHIRLFTFYATVYEFIGGIRKIVVQVNEGGIPPWAAVKPGIDPHLIWRPIIIFWDFGVSVISKRTACHVSKVSTFISFSRADHSGLTCRDAGCRVIQGGWLGGFAEMVIHCCTHTHM